MQAIFQSLLSFENSRGKSKAGENPAIPTIRPWQNPKDFHSIF